MKQIILLFLFITPLYFFGNDKEFLSDKMRISSADFINEKLFIPEIIFYKTEKKPEIKKSIPVQKKKPIINTNLKNKRKAAVAVNVTGAGFLLAGVSLLAASLAYSDYIEKNETDYDKYINGKNLSRGLFYGSTAGLGTGGICLTVSIPLFIEPKAKTKSKNIKKK